VLKYVDDENDLCTISTQLELDYAVSHSPLRLKVTKCSDSPVASVDKSAAEPVTPAPSQRVQFLKDKLAFIQTTLQKPDLPPHRIENLNKRKAILEWKLERIQSPDSHPVFPLSAEGRRTGPCGNKDHKSCEDQTTEGPCHFGPGCPRGRGHWHKTGEDEQTPVCGRGGRGRGGRGCWNKPCEGQSAESPCFHVRGPCRKMASDDQTPEGPAFGRGGRGRGQNKEKNWQNPQIQEMNTEISGLREIMKAKKIAIQNAKLAGAPKSEIETLFEAFVLARNNLRAKKLAKRELKDSLLKARTLENAQRKEVVPQTSEPACTKKAMNPELAELQKEIVTLRQIMWMKKEALTQARKAGAPKEEIEILFESFVTARTNLREKKVAKRNMKDAAWLKQD
jgi:hypothetical protein